MIKHDNTLHLWKIPLNIPESELAPSFSLLNEDEQHRARQFRFDKHRRRFIAAHLALRNILAQHLKISVRAVEIQVDKNGKPEILNTPLHFNMSHSEELAIIGVSYQNELGVDIEHFKDDIDIIGISTRFFHPLESKQLQQIPPSKRQHSFYQCWTAKEAYLKAKGLGIANHLKMFALDLQDPDKTKILRVEEGFEEYQNWFVETFSIEQNYLATVVSVMKPDRIIVHDYQLSL